MRKDFTTILDLYKEGYSLQQISNITGRTKNSIGNSLRRKGFKPNLYDKLDNSQTLDQLIIGGSLGDGYVTKKREGTESYMVFSHGEKQLDYLKWKKSILDNFNLTSDKGIYNYRDESSRYKMGYCDTYYLRSKVHPLFSNYRQEYYPLGIKIVPKSVDRIKPLGLAIWYLDDGNICTRSYQINTSGFSVEDCNTLINVMKNNFDLEFTLQKRNVLYLRTKCIDKFESLIKDYIPDCMKYKIRSGSI